jgi:hypothetical protein
MKNPEIIILPILMFMDYFLTVYGAIQKESKYDEHFKTQHYELNPILQNQIAEKRWFNPRHIFMVLAITVALAALTEFAGLPDSFIQGVLGCLFVFFGMIIGRHLSNIMIFRYIADNSNSISGQITMAHSMSLSISMYQYIVAVIPMIFVALFTPAPFVLGGLVGAVCIFVVHAKWIFQHKRQSQSSSRAEVGDDK